MRINPVAAASSRLTRFYPNAALLALVGYCWLVAPPGCARAAERQWLSHLVPSAVTNAPVVRPGSRWERLDLTLALPLRNRASLTNLLRDLYDPASPNYHHFLTPEQFARNFGPTEQDYQAVISFARSHGLTVTGRHANRTLVKVRGTVGDIERTFHVTLNEYQHPTESRTFRAPNVEPSLELAVPLLTVGGLDDFVVPHPCWHPAASGQAKPALSGSGPGGTYFGRDFRAAYLPGVPLTGSGQTVGLLEFDAGFYPSDISAYENQAGLPNVPVSAVLLDGYNGAAGGNGNVEVSLDIELAISMAPGLNGVLVYEGSSTDDILNRMATDGLAGQIGASWTYPTDAASDQIFLQFAAQGQTFFNASGDNGAYAGAPASPTDDPYITVVGGTTLTTSGPGGGWVSETTWTPDSGGGISTRYAIPSWQQGIDMSANLGSSTQRNLPDVAMVADDVYVICNNGQGLNVGGTSCATPLWAAFTALANQLALTNGEPMVGFLAPAVYAMGKGSNALSYGTLFHDITTGDNENQDSPWRFFAVAGYDLCTGWGTPTGSNLLAALAFAEPLLITPSAGVTGSGPAGGPFSPATLSFSLTNQVVGAMNWSLANTSLWFNVSPSGGTLLSGGPAMTVQVNLTAAVALLPAGSYSSTLWFTNLSDRYVQTRQVTLAVVTPPVITRQPASQALPEGMTASFSVGTATNAMLNFQWQENGTNLTDGGNLSGSLTSLLIISNVTFASAGAYAVAVSNAAGSQTSSNALLTIVPSAPVIVEQPTNQSVVPGGSATFNVAVVGNLPDTFQWQMNGTNLTPNANDSGVTNSSLTVKNVMSPNAGAYSVIVSNPLGLISSTGATLTVISLTPPGVTLTSLASFSNGKYPYCPLVQGGDGGFYGTTVEGGNYGLGTVFKATTNGVLSTLTSFYSYDGADPYAGLDLGADGYFYGLTDSGGTYNAGTAFRISSSGALSSLTFLTGNDGELPVSGLVQGSDGNFYGTTYEGGAYGYGTVFRMTSSGVLTTLVSFAGADGSNPSSVLVPGGDGDFYGTTESGGENGGAGTVFKMTPAGQLTVLYAFSGGLDGAIPNAGLVQGVDGSFFGTTYGGGDTGYGTVFKIESSGALTTLHSFTGGSDGGTLWGGLVQATDGNLYGTTQGGGLYGFGTVFQIAPTGRFATLVQFDGYLGSDPSAAPIQGTDGNLYGTTETGGASGDGTIYRLNINGPLQITAEPEDQATDLGGTALFTVATSGGAPVFYQWQRNGVNLTNGGGVSGVTTAILMITNVMVGDAALYSVLVTNSFNALTSDEAVLEVIYSPPDITTQPVSQTSVAGTTVQFSVAARGNQPLAYQWQENGTNLTDTGSLSGSVTSTLTLTGVTAANGGSYSVIVSNGLFAVSSAKAALTVVSATVPGASATSVLFSGGGDGAFPFAGLVQGNDNNLYGCAEGGGGSFQGAVFRMTPAGVLTTLHGFAYGTSGGEDPYAPLAQGTNGYFYGATYLGGGYGEGTLFKMTTNGAVTFLYWFTGGVDGKNPQNGLIQGADGNWYGTTLEGGANAYGSVFQLTAGGAFTTLYSFTGETDGAYPNCGLVQGRDGNFYGTTMEGGTDDFGTVFRLTTNGTVTTLVSFNDANGGNPQAGVIPGADGRFYGTTYEGGSGGEGTVFSLTTNGTLTTLCSFGSTNGGNPAAALVQATDGNFYGATTVGGDGGQGTVFKITSGGALTTLLSFDGLNGADPQAALVQANNGSFYGTTPQGGVGYNPSVGGGNGVIFRLTLPMFTSNSFPAAPAIACLPYTASLPAQTTAPPGDPLAFAKVSGPAWLAVAANGALSGTPTNSDIGTNRFVVSLTDTNGLSATTSLNLVVAPDPAPGFLSNPFAEPWAKVGGDYDESLATNATAPYLDAGDILTFAKLSGPAWLSVAANGLLSGTPGAADGGTNLFVVSVTDLGGASATATLLIYVNNPPAFTSPSFTKPAATAGLPYAGTVATNAADPDLGAGDTLAFYKVTGPAWLNVAANGALSGTPTSANLGANSFLLLVVDSGGLAAVGTLELGVNSDTPPSFLLNPFTGPLARAGQSYCLEIATNASDPNFGDPLTFAKVSGPAWLSVSANGGISGTPYSSNAGTNSLVLSVTDFEGLSANATLNIVVTAVPIVGTITQQGGNLLLAWTGGVAPYQVQSATNLVAPAWQNAGGPTSTTNRMLTPGQAVEYYRIQGQ